MAALGAVAAVLAVASLVYVCVDSVSARRVELWGWTKVRARRMPAHMATDLRQRKRTQSNHISPARAGPPSLRARTHRAPGYTQDSMESGDGKISAEEVEQLNSILEAQGRSVRESRVREMRL